MLFEQVVSAIRDPIESVVETTNTGLLLVSCNAYNAVSERTYVFHLAAFGPHDEVCLCTHLAKERAALCVPISFLFLEYYHIVNECRLFFLYFYL